MENLPRGESSVIVVNHRSTADIFFAPLFTPLNTAVFVRAWPFKIWIFKWFMRGAGYIDIESTPLPEFFESAGRALSERGVSFLFFPEGHRSRDGRLQRFKSGAFLTSEEFNIPIVPVVLTGTETFLSMRDNLFRPAVVKVEILPPIDPATFPAERRALKLRRHVESIFKEHLHES